nr:hypothetical protein CFP56_19180 [Quercus suber]
MGHRQQKLNSLLGLGVLKVEKRSGEREAQPWIKELRRWRDEEHGFCFLLSEKRREKGQREYKMYSLS